MSERRWRWWIGLGGMGLLVAGGCLGLWVAGHRVGPVREPATPILAEGQDAGVLPGGIHGAGSPSEGLEQRLRDMDRAGMPPATEWDRLTIWLQAQPATSIASWWMEMAEVLSPSLRSRWDRACLTAWALSDPRHLVETASAWPSSQRRSLALQEGVTRWADDDPRAAWAWVKGQPAGPERIQWTGVVSVPLAGVDPDTALSAWRRLPAPHRIPLAGPFLTHLAGRDPARAARELGVEANSGRSAGPETAASILALWIRRDPSAALAWWMEAGSAPYRRWGVEAFWEGLAGRDPASALRLWEAQREAGHADPRIMAWMLAGWAGTDPEAVARWVDGQPDPVLRRNGQIALARASRFPDPSGAAARLDQVSRDGRWDPGLWVEVGRNWALADPVSAWAWADGLGKTPAAWEVRMGVLSGWSHVDPAAAAAKAVSVPDTGWRQQGVARVVSEWAGMDGKAALAWSRSLTDPILQREVIRWVVSSVDLGGVDPGTALGFMSLLPPGQGRLDAVAQLAGGLARRDVPGAVEWMRQLQEPLLREAALERIADAWWQTDPDGMRRHVLALPEGGVRDRVVERMAVAWAGHDPESALREVLEREGGATRQRLLERVIQVWASREPAAAAGFVAGLETGSGRDLLAATVAEVWGRREPARALAWAERLTGGEARVRAVAGAVGAWVTTDPYQAAAYVAELPSGALQERAVLTVTAGLAATDPDYAASWLARFPPGRAREMAQQGLLRSWVRADADAATAWVLSLGEGPNRDHAVAEMSRLMLERSPSTAWAWAMQVKDGARRDGLLRDAAREWLRTDPATARAGIRGSGLDPESVERILLP